MNCTKIGKLASAICIVKCLPFIFTKILFIYFQISDILKISEEDRTEEQIEVLSFSPDIVSKCEKNRQKRDNAKARAQEVCSVLSKLFHIYAFSQSCESMPYCGQPNINVIKLHFDLR